MSSPAPTPTPTTYTSTPSAATSPTATTVTPTEAHVLVLEETGDSFIWTVSVAGITSGALLGGLVIVLMVVLCRKRQVRKEQLLREHLYYTVGDRLPPPSSARPAEESPSNQPVMLTNYTNLPHDAVTPSRPVDIPGATRNVADTITNSAYSGGDHYDRIPGEPDSVEPSVASEHVYSVIKDEGTAKKQVVTQPTTVQKRRQQDTGELGRLRRGARELEATAEAIDMAGEGFIELLPRTVEGYDLLKHQERQKIQELSIVLELETYDQLNSLDNEPNDKLKGAYVFNPYGGESDSESFTLQEDTNPYENTVGITSQLHAVSSGSNVGVSSSLENVLAAGNGKLAKDKPSPWEVDQDCDMAHAYDAIDELQKQIHILSKSIPTLDTYGYEDLDKIKPAPKASRSIPVLDVAGYEDLDAVKPTIPKKQQAKVGYDFDSHSHESIVEKQKGRHSLGALVDPEKERSPSVQARKIEQMYTAVHKPKSSTIMGHPMGARKQNKRQDSVGRRSSSNENLFESAPPVPPLTIEALYTAVQKPKKSSTAKSVAKGEVGIPAIPPKPNTDEEPPLIPPKTIASMYTAVQKQPKAKKATNNELPTFKFEVVPPPIPPKSVKEAYLAAQRGEIPPIPPRAHERVYSGVYRHKEKQTLL